MAALLVCASAQAVPVSAYSMLRIRDLAASWEDLYHLGNSFNPFTTTETMLEVGYGIMDPFSGDAGGVCSGACAGIADNNFERFAQDVPGAGQEFSRGDVQVVSSIPDGLLTIGPFFGAALTSSTVGEVNLVDPLDSGYGFGSVSGLHWFSTVGSGPTIRDMTIVLGVEGTLLAASESPAGAAHAAFAWSLEIFDRSNPRDVAARFAPEALNRAIEVNGVGAEQHAFDTQLRFTVSGLRSHAGYGLRIEQTSIASAALNDLPTPVPAPPPAALLALGIGGFAVWRRRLR